MNALTVVPAESSMTTKRRVDTKGLKRALLRAADRLDGLDLPKPRKKHVGRLANAFEETAVALEAGDFAEAATILTAVLGVEVELGAGGKPLVAPLVEQVKMLGAGA